MLKLDDIVALARAGYTADQIGQMAAAAAPAEQTPEQPADLQPTEPAPQAQPAEPAEPAPQQAPAGQQDPYQRLLDELGLIRNQLQANNRSSAQLPEEQQLTGEQVLANIIAPPRRTTK